MFRQRTSFAAGPNGGGSLNAADTRQSSLSEKAALMAVFVFGGANASYSAGIKSLIEGSVQIAILSAPEMLAGAEVAARLVVAWIGLASHSSFAIGSGATCMFAHQFVSLPW